MQAEGDRRLATILAIDVAGYSAAAERDQAAAAQLVAALRSRIDELASVHGGRVFSTAGDGFMLEFPLASACVQAAVALLKDTARPESGLPPVHAGAHLGEVIVTGGGDLLGHGVNVAARLCARAGRNGLVISDALKSQIHGEISAAFAPLGLLTLSKMAEPVVAHAYVAAPDPLAELRRRLRLFARRRWRVLAIGALSLLVVAPAAIWTATRTPTYELEPMQLVAQSWRYEMLPSLSPDGRFIAYAAETGPELYTNVDLFMRAVDGGEETPVATDPSLHERSAAFSPTGDRLAYVRSVPRRLRRSPSEHRCEIMVRVLPNGVDRKAGGCETPGPDLGLSWTPDGTGLVYADVAPEDIQQGRPSRIRLLDLQTGRARDLIAPLADGMGDFSPDISPDGTRVAFVRYSTAVDATIYVYHLRSRRLTRVTEGLTWAQLAWADADNLFVMISPEGAGTELWITPASGRGMGRRVLPGLSVLHGPEAVPGLLALEVEAQASNLRRYVDGRSSTITSGNQYDADADFSRDGALAFLSLQPRPWLYVQPRDGSPRRLVELTGINPRGLRWSPDGSRIVYSAQGDRHYGLYLAEVASGLIEPIPVANDDAELGAPAWAPDGRSIVFSRMDAQGTRLMRVFLEDATVEAISDYGWEEGIETPDGLFAVSAARPGVWRLAPGRAPVPVLSGIAPLFDNAGPVAPWRGWTVAEGRVYIVDRLSRPNHIRVLSSSVSGGPVTTAMDIEGHFLGSLAVDPLTGALVFGVAVNQQSDIGVIRFRRR